MPGRRNKPKPIVAVGEVVMWLLFALLLAPAGAVGWAIGHYTGHQGGTRTVTVSAPATTTAPTTTATAPKTTTAAAATAAGKAIFISAGCGACHTFKAAGTSATIGPDLDTAPAADAKKTNTALAAFVHESIVNPEAYIAPGFPKNVMPKTFGTSLSKAQLDTLVSFIVSGK